MTDVVGTVAAANNSSGSSGVDSIEGRVSVMEAVFEERHRLYLSLFASQERTTQEQMLASHMAVQKSEVATEKRFESVNAFREALTDAASRQMPRTEIDSKIAGLGDKIDALQTRIDKSEGVGNGLRSGWGLLASAVGVVAILIGGYASLNAAKASGLDSRIDDMVSRMNALSNRLSSLPFPVTPIPAQK